jgi:hypothetical protein
MPFPGHASGLSTRTPARIELLVEPDSRDMFRALTEIEAKAGRTSDRHRDRLDELLGTSYAGHRRGRMHSRG